MPTSRDIKADFKGLVTAPGLLVRAEASCTTASNVVFDAPGVIRKRRGFVRLTGSTGGPNWRMFSSRLMGDKVLTHIGTASGTALAYGDGSGALATVGMVAGSALTMADNAARMAMGICARNHYLTAAEGVARIESSMNSATQRFAGMPRGIQPGLVGNGTTMIKPLAGRPIGDGYARAYRITWHLKDADGVELGGAPTARAVGRNQTGLVGYTGVACGFELQVAVPRELGTLGTAVSTSFFWRLWGTRTFNSVGGDQGDDEMYLVAEAFLTAGEITAGYATYTDLTPDSFLTRQRRLHTNSQNFPDAEVGIVQGTANEDAPPPIAKDITYWNDVMWYADLSYRQRLQVRLLTTGGTGLVAADTITITGPTGATAVVTGVAGAPAAASQFTVFTALATTQMNVEATGMGIAEAINAYGAGTLGAKAYYVSVGSQAPGYIYLEATVTGATTLAFTPSRAAAFSLGINGGFGATDAQANALAFSKQGRADAVPPVNTFTVGNGDSRILRIHPYRDRLLVFTDVGIFQVVGRTFADFAVLPFDLGYRLMVRESVVTCDDRVYAWCFEGIIEISNSGVEVISTVIEPTVTEALRSTGDFTGAGGVTSGQTAFGVNGYAVAYRNQHRVMFFYPEANDTSNINGCADWLCWDTRTRAWSTGRFAAKMGATYRDNRSCGVVRYSDDLLVMGNWSSGADTYLTKERRGLAATDYQDETAAGDVGAVSCSVAFQYQIPDIEGAAHWQQTTLHFEGGELTWRTVPTVLGLTWGIQPDSTTASATALAANTQPFWRTEVPTTVRRGNRLRIIIQHGTAEHFGLIGVTQSARVGTRFLVRGT